MLLMVEACEHGDAGTHSIVQICGRAAPEGVIEAVQAVVWDRHWAYLRAAKGFRDVLERHPEYALGGGQVVAGEPERVCVARVPREHDHAAAGDSAKLEQPPCTVVPVVV